MEVRFFNTLHFRRRSHSSRWAQSIALYVGGDMNACSARYPVPVTPIVSPHHRIYLSAHSINFLPQTFKFIPGATR